MTVPLHIFEARLRHGLGPGTSWLTTVLVEAIDQDEASVLMIAVVRSRYQEAKNIRFEHRPEQLDGEINPSDFSRFTVGETVLAANPIISMLDPLPAYTAWQLREIESIPSGGPYLWADKEGNVIFVGLAPYGVRKVEIS